MLSQTINSTFLDFLQAHSRAKQLLNVRYSELDHCWSLQTQSPCNYWHILWETHRPDHFRPENSWITNLHILLQNRMHTFITSTITENLHRWLCVRIVSWLETNVLNSDLLVKFIQNTNQVVQAQVSVNDESFDLMEFSQMSVVQSLVSEHSVNWEELSWPEWLFLCNLF